MKRNAFALILGNLCAPGVQIETEGPKDVSSLGCLGVSLPRSIHPKFLGLAKVVSVLGLVPPARFGAS